MIRAAALAAAAFLLVFAIMTLGVLGGLAGERHCGVKASWYGTESCVSTPCVTRSGDKFTGNDMTGAMSSVKHLGERWRVSVGRQWIVVRINDTGSFAKYGVGIDLSKAAFASLAPLARGKLTVCLEKLS